MSISLILSGLGAIMAAIGIGMLVSRCRRIPRGDLIAWSVALLGLLVSLVAQAFGHLIGFGEISFRAMEIGAQVIAPLALLVGLAELVARSVPGRFAGRLFIPALGFIALVILGTDPLSGTAFTKSWPAPAVYYQLIPNKLVEYGLAPVSLIVAIILVAIAAVRARREAQWRAVFPAVAAAGVAVFALVLLGLAPALANHLGLNLPLNTLFAFFCLLAAGLTWFAGVAVDRVPVAVLRDGGADYRGAPSRGAGHRGANGARNGGAGYGRADRDGEGYDDQDEDGADHDGWGHDRHRSGIEQTGDFESYDDGSQGVYRGGGLYRDEPAGVRSGAVGGAGDDSGYGWQRQGDDYDSRELDAVYGYDTGSQVGYETGSQDIGYDSGSHIGYDTEGGGPALARTGDFVAAAVDPAHAGPRPGEPDGFAPAAGPAAGREGTRAELFGQIAIYTLIEDSVHEFDRLTERVVRRVRGSEPNTLVYIVHAVPSAPMQRILYEVYRDRGAYDWHQQQPYVTEFEADRRPYVLATNIIELGLQQAKVSPFPSIADLFGEPGHDTSGFERPDYTREYGSSAGQNGTSR
jgi:quinol monooxygenase YgiN